MFMTFSMLALILVQAFDLHVEDGVRVERARRYGLREIFCKTGPYCCV